MKIKQILSGFFLCCFALGVSGCVPTRGLKPHEVVKHPDAPMLIQEVKGNHFKVAIYDAKENRLIEYGWIRATDSMVGWTISKVDWQKFMKKKSNGR